MPMAFTLDAFAKASAEVRDAIERCRPEAVGKAMLEDTLNCVKDHLRSGGLETTRPNELGGERTHFWEQAADSLSHSISGSELRVSVNKLGFAQRFFGGEIKATNADWVTIPARSEAHGKRAGEFNNLRFVQFSEDTAALVEAERTDVQLFRRKKENLPAVSERARAAGGLVMYWLKHSVTQPADPSVLPSADLLADTAMKAAADFAWTFE
jgi:hypothetical protein